MKTIMIMFLLLCPIVAVANEPLDFGFVDASGTEYRVSSLPSQLESEYGHSFADIRVFLIETPDLNDKEYLEQERIIDTMPERKVENLQLIFVVACPIGTYMDGYHTSLETAKTLMVNMNRFRVRLLNAGGSVLFESATSVSAGQLQHWVEESTSKSPLAAPSLAGETNIINVFGQACIHGLHTQPNGGPFSVFIFCDDALGTNLGVILTERGAGPGKIELNDPKVWDKWTPVNRFWQEAAWSADVVNFAWSPSHRYLYIATSGAYGNGGFFKLDLQERTYQRLMPRPNAPYKSQLVDGYFTRIEDTDLESGKITVAILQYNEGTVRVATGVFPFE